MRRVTALYLLLSCLILSGCTKDLLLRKPNPIISNKKLLQGDVIVLMDRKVVRLDPKTKSMHIDAHTHLLLRTPKACLQLKRILHHFESSSKLKAFQARIFRPDGSSARAQYAYLFPSANFSSPRHFDDQQIKTLMLDKVTPGSILDFRLQKEVRLPVSGWRFTLQHPMWWTRDAYLKISYPAEMPIRHKLYPGFQAPLSLVKTKQTRSSSTPVRKELIWSARHLPPLKKEEGMPFWQHHLLRVDMNFGLYQYGNFMGKGHSWKQIGSFFWKIFQSRATPSTEAKKKARALTKGAKNKEQKARILYDFVRRRIRYLFVGLGLGGYQPQSPDKTLRYRYGDCKAKAQLLTVMLRTIGIKAHLVLVRTRDNGKLSASFPVGGFNHVIVFLPGVRGGLFVDPTTDDNRLEYLRWDNQGSSGLLLAPTNSRFLTLPVRAAKNNLFHRITTLKRGQKGRISGTLEIKQKGFWRIPVDGLLERGRLQKNSERTKWIKSNNAPFLHEYLPWLQLQKTDPFREQGGGLQSLRTTFSSKRGLRSLWLPFTHFRSPWLQHYLATRKYHAFELKQRFTHVEELVVEGWKVVDWPKKHLSFQNAFLAFSFSCKKQQDKIRCQRTITVKKLSLPLHALRQLKAWSPAIQKALHRLLVLEATK